MSGDGLAGTGGGAVEGESEPMEALQPKGHWPPWHEKFRNDFRSAKRAKSNDGLLSPPIDDPAWTTSPGAHTHEVLEAARRRAASAMERISVAEARAHRIVQMGLTLLAVAFLIAGFTAERVRSGDAGGGWWIAVAVTIAPILLLALTITQAISVDRVSYVNPAEPGPAAEYTTADDQRRNLIMQENRARLMADWTARHKVNEFLQARAWLTRSITALIAAGLAASFTWLFVGQAPT